MNQTHITNGSRKPTKKLTNVVKQSQAAAANVYSTNTIGTEYQISINKIKIK